jgi:hypothetical protein
LCLSKELKADGSPKELVTHLLVHRVSSAVRQIHHQIDLITRNSINWLTYEIIDSPAPAGADGFSSFLSFSPVVSAGFAVVPKPPKRFGVPPVGIEVGAAGVSLFPVAGGAPNRLGVGIAPVFFSGSPTAGVDPNNDVGFGVLPSAGLLKRPDPGVGVDPEADNNFYMSSNLA